MATTRRRDSSRNGTPDPAQESPRAHGIDHPIDKYLVFAFGVVFLSVLLWLLFRDSTPLDKDRAHIVRLVSALAAGGMGVVLPGFIEINYKGFLRAGGGIALFVLVYVYEPQRMVDPDVWPPPNNAEEVIERHLALIDANNYAEAYLELSPDARKRYSSDEFRRAFETARATYGVVQSRSMVSSTAPSTLPFTSEPGPYKIQGFRTTFANGVQTVESVIAQVNAAKWRIFEHSLLPCPNNQCP